jgi:hypothetical protein
MLRRSFCGHNSFRLCWCHRVSLLLLVERLRRLLRIEPPAWGKVAPWGGGAYVGVDYATLGRRASDVRWPLWARLWP